MGFKLDRVHVWSAEVADRAGGVATKLAALASRRNLEFISPNGADKPAAASCTWPR